MFLCLVCLLCCVCFRLPMTSVGAWLCLTPEDSVAHKQFVSPLRRATSGQRNPERSDRS